MAPENDTNKAALADGPTGPTPPVPAGRRRWGSYLLGAALLVAFAGAAWWAWRPFAEEPSAWTVDVQRQIVDASLWADAAAAEVVLADVRADVAGNLRSDEIRARAHAMVGRVGGAVAPLERSDRVDGDDVDASLDLLRRSLGVADPEAAEALDALVRQVAQVGP